MRIRSVSLPKTFSKHTVTCLDGGQKVDALFVDLVLPGDEAVKRISPYSTSQGITDEMQALFVENFAFLDKPYTAEVRPL